MVKRHHGIKDFSGMLGPVGGMLDRLDSLIGAGWIFLIFLKTIHQPFQGEKISIKLLNDIYKTNINSLHCLAPERRHRFCVLY